MRAPQASLTPARLKRLYGLLSARMIDFDCGRLCAPANNGVPVCCDVDHAIPVLYRPEFDSHRGSSRFWRKLRLDATTDRELAALLSIDDYCVLATCSGAKGCKRALRSIACRSFPFEPHLDTAGNLVGLTFIYRMERTCPLIGMPRKVFNPAFLRRALLAWQQLLHIYPQERAALKQESAAVRRRFRRRGRRIEIFN